MAHRYFFSSGDCTGRTLLYRDCEGHYWCRELCQGSTSRGASSVTSEALLSGLPVELSLASLFRLYFAAKTMQSRQARVHLFLSGGPCDAPMPFSSSRPAATRSPAPAELLAAGSSEQVRNFSYFVAPRLNAHEISFSDVLLDRFFLLSQESDLFQNTSVRTGEKREASSSREEDMVLEYLADLFTHAGGQARASVLFLLISRIFAGAEFSPSQGQQGAPRTMWQAAVRSSFEALRSPDSLSRELSAHAKAPPSEPDHGKKNSGYSDHSRIPDPLTVGGYEGSTAWPSRAQGGPTEQAKATSPRRLSTTTVESAEHWWLQRQEGGRRILEAFRGIWREVLRRELRGLYGVRNKRRAAQPSLAALADKMPGGPEPSVGTYSVAPPDARAPTR